MDAVVIGRNEGQRLSLALNAVVPHARRVIYVDSGSHDESVARAHAMGAEIVALDPVRPFSAARARNEGFAALGPARAAFVHFVDGDCILQRDWPQTAHAFLQDHPEAGLVIGRYAEEQPDSSPYNWLTDWEWQKPTGPCAGGIGTFLTRSTAFEQTGGFRDTMIAAEDDEMFLRMRKAGWQTWAIDAPMVRHDVALHAFGNWNRRMIRAGHSFAELGALHPGAARAARRRALVWGGALPALALVLAAVWPPGVIGIAALYAMSIMRQALRFRHMGLAQKRAVLAAGLVMLSKFSNLWGMGQYWWRRLRRQDAQIIEYR
ncbi:MAG: glycosyltransferase family 2 protein [Rhodobacteraceae bacterium]|nr:glycosyltransferase family 2 protein [Paracoccaceae bacterium]TVR47355.1 MAG: glycosyltransferase family 2 protein [Paracoccaceae bacterium]